MTTATITTMNLRERIGDILNRVRYTGERFIVERKGEPIAAIIRVEDLERLERLELEREIELVHLAKMASQKEGMVSFEDLLNQYEALHGERLETPTDA